MCNHWGHLTAHAEEQYEQLESHLERVRYQCRLNVRRALEAAGERVTEEKVKERAALMQDFINAQDDLRAAKNLWRHLRVVVRAMEHRTDMLRSLNSRLNRELDEYPRSHRMSTSDDDASLDYEDASYEEIRAQRLQQLQERKGQSDEHDGQVPTQDGTA